MRFTQSGPNLSHLLQIPGNKIDRSLDRIGLRTSQCDVRVGAASLGAEPARARQPAPIGTAAFTKAGQIRYAKTSTHTWVFLNTDSDTTAEAVIRLKGVFDLSKAWFAL